MAGHASDAGFAVRRAGFSGARATRCGLRPDGRVARLVGGPGSPVTACVANGGSDTVTTIATASNTAGASITSEASPMPSRSRPPLSPERPSLPVSALPRQHTERMTTTPELGEPTSIAVAGRAGYAVLDTAQASLVPTTSGTFFGRRMTAGHIYTIAGVGRPGYAGDGAPAVSGSLYFPACGHGRRRGRRSHR